MRCGRIDMRCGRIDTRCGKNYICKDASVLDRPAAVHLRIYIKRWTIIECISNKSLQK